MMRETKSGMDTVIFRCDGNASIGSGHVMRCLSIADAAKNAGFHPIFITAGDEFKSVIYSHGFENTVLNTDYRKLENELNVLLPLIEQYDPTGLFVDSYFVTEEYLCGLQRACRKSRSSRVPRTELVYMDDLAAFPYPVDYLINYNIYGTDWESKYVKLHEYFEGPKGHNDPFRMLLGPSYAPLRAEFQNLPKRVVERYARNILISTGGADVEHMTVALARAVKAVGDLSDGEMNFHFIIGSMNGDKVGLNRLAADNPHIVLHENVKQMASLMQRMDIAISAAGSTLYELCVTQTPTITYIIADNQIPGAEGFKRHGVLNGALDVRVLGQAVLAEKLIHDALELASDYGRRVEMAEKMSTVVDGKGAERIIETIFGSA